MQANHVFIIQLYERYSFKNNGLKNPNSTRPFISTKNIQIRQIFLLKKMITYTKIMQSLCPSSLDNQDL